MHGYHLAAGIEALMMVVKVMSAREYYDSVYSVDRVSNMITDVTNWFYNCLAENVTTLRLSNEDKVDAKNLTSITTKCINYAAKHISKITEHKIYDQYMKMKKTDIFCIDFDQVSIDNYRQMKRLDINTMISNINSTYGMVCRLAVCLGWLIGIGDEQKLGELESLADNIGMLIKIHDDFKHHKRDMRFGSISSNFVVTHGIKEALILYDDAHIQYLEKSNTVGVETKTCNEIVKCIVDYVSDVTATMSVDIDTEYDDITSYTSHVSSTSHASHAKRNSRDNHVRHDHAKHDHVRRDHAEHAPRDSHSSYASHAKNNDADDGSMSCSDTMMNRHQVVIE